MKYWRHIILKLLNEFSPESEVIKSTTPLNTMVFGVCLSSPQAVLMRFSYLKYNLITKGSNAYRTNQRKMSLQHGLKTNLILFLAKPLKRVSIGRKCIFENSQKFFLWKLVLASSKVSPVVLVKLWLIEIFINYQTNFAKSAQKEN